MAHTSVMPEETLRCWVSNPNGLYVDGTAGGGGHDYLLLERHPQVRLVAIDQDPAALRAAGERLNPFRERVTLIHGNFRRMRELLSGAGVVAVDGILLDLGVSSPQLDVAHRGFSYQQDAPLDMRMDPANEVTAFRLVNTKPAEEITTALRDWGEERWASRIAAFMVDARRNEPIRTTGQLVDIIKAAIPAAARRGGGHPARRTFQALRIWVNDELGALADGLDSGVGMLTAGGRFAVISFHSLEDRLVKRRFRDWNADGRGLVLTRRPLVPGQAELNDNPRSRSAKLRAFQRR
ncbi:MAG: 16S rRNA (cytosine(1402)-N(4))-methyltransferase RsmH [Thermaerobacter sp.]|nr:16S rRNA (cytosine(1402)-N(4))-methyltransferase RsmH [Thermaerobacter sp.]